MQNIMMGGGVVIADEEKKKVKEKGEKWGKTPYNWNLHE